MKQIKQSDMLKCPHRIIAPEHYRDDGSCRCNDPTHMDMKEWGYVWDGYAWVPGLVDPSDEHY